jgi:hypothetical protein
MASAQSMANILKKKWFFIVVLYYSLDLLKEQVDRLEAMKSSPSICTRCRLFVAVTQPDTPGRTASDPSVIQAAFSSKHNHTQICSFILLLMAHINGHTATGQIAATLPAWFLSFARLKVHSC